MKDLDWPKLILDISEALVLTQRELGEQIGTTQQSVSNWLNGRRVPSDNKAEIFIKLAEDAGLRLKNYELSPSQQKISTSRSELKSLPLNIRRLVVQLMELNTRKRNKVMSYLDDMMAVIEEREKKEE